MKCVLLSGLILALAGPSLAAPGTFTLVGAAPKTLTPATLAAAQKAPVVRGKIVRLVVVTGPDNDMLSYRIGGRRNPALAVPRGATLRVLFVNTDDDMSHDIRFGPAWKTYPNVMTAYLKSSVGTPSLPHKSEAALRGEEMTLRAPTTPGRYVYLCTVRGHAQGGMVGTILVR